MSKLVTAIFNSRSQAEMAVDELTKAGFSRDDISLLMSESTRGREFAVKKTTKVPEAAAAGMTVGGVLGAVAAGLAAVGTLVVPGLSLVAAGPLVAAVAGLGAGAAAGGLTGALIGLGIPEHEAKFYDQEITKGGILIGVYAHDDRAKIAREVLESAGAEKVGRA
ncbi:MAG TPA: general stress protein [Candidatus Limnocylindrales bacterium]|nr:general stress protein [Candidatus Limnocylindrales bacterium]